ncbi:hypothetical protein AB1484_27670 [Parafrankia sp. FMc6]|uniref:hypothetical protein n=1 Tax=Parafrankia soli TaxID=2599596 RepID=UPI0034D6FF94
MNSTMIHARRRAGPVPHLLRQTPPHVKLDEGLAVLRLVAAGSSIRGAASTLGLSVTTAWRRYWWVLDWTLPDSEGLPRGPFPPQRGTRACPSGRPYLPTWPIDNPAVRRPIRRIHGNIPVCARDVLITTGAIGRRLSVTRERARQLSHQPGFPTPEAREGRTRYWAACDVETWISQHRPHLADG